MGLPDSHGVPRDPRYLGACPEGLVDFRLRGYHPLWPHLSRVVQLIARFVTFPEPCMTLKTGPATPHTQRMQPYMHMVWAVPLSLAATHGVAFCFLFLGLLRCFNSPSSPPRPMYSVEDHPVLPGGVSPFGNPRVACFQQTVAYRR